MLCSISGEVPQEPVVSKLTGHIYERRLIEKYLKDKQVCPVSGQTMTETDLLAVQGMNSATMARPPSATSVPSLIAFLQNEWDALMLEVVELKKALDVARQEASHALFQYDGACMMIAKLLKEKDELNEQLQRTKTTQTPHDQETLQ